ncbi:ECF RNA polymerase sigma factor SigR [Neolewinella maritima]|uniref:ECF RNA polymerase sigma factor SigR n=1 Tax=Neolewinella maritima TaxID=1383882 RepID=A0ABN8F573_9BACT|nr:RNA polymerase sigma factor [Neolewinella maritima]CAH0999382.1 ECF RNA polymerase sigma factor SigR [Neolewinella maritima]
MYEVPSSADWSDTYAAYSAELREFVRTRVPAPEVDDLLQDVWVRLAEALETQHIAQPRAWLYRVTRNRIADLYRGQESRPAVRDLQDGDAYVAPTLSGDTTDVLEEITDALDLLPPKQREVFTRNELEGETLREIADDLGVPLKTVISRKGYARRRLQDILLDTYVDYFGLE